MNCHAGPPESHEEDAISNPAHSLPTDASTAKGQKVCRAPFPSYNPTTTHPTTNLLLTTPPLVAGALVLSFARHVASALGDPLFASYYLTHQKVLPSLDRALDRLLAAFTRALWTELWERWAQAGTTEAERRGFEGPLRQVVLILNGPETAGAILRLCAPGLSRRGLGWAVEGAELGVDLPLALRLLCTLKHTQMRYAAAATAGTIARPEASATTLLAGLTDSHAAGALLAGIRHTLMNPHHVSVHQLESAVWEVMAKQRGPPPADGFRVAQFRVRCRLSWPMGAVPEKVVITGTKEECRPSTVADYTAARFPRCGRLLLRCLGEAAESAPQGWERAGYASSTFDGSADPTTAAVAGVQTMFLEILPASVQVSIYARPPTLVEVLQHVSWLCAVLADHEDAHAGGTAEEEGTQSGQVERAIEVTDLGADPESLFVESRVISQRFAPEHGARWLMDVPQARVARGFPPLHAVRAE